MSLRLLALIARRILFGVVLLLAVSVLIFAGTQILPGDVAQAILGQSATPQSLANLRNQLGLDEPAYIRYFNWLHGFLSGDLGKSLSTGQDIALSISERLANTLFLAACAAAVAVPLAILLGLVSVRYHNRMPDKIISTLSLASTSVPEFFIGYVLVYFFAIKWQLFPPISVVYDGMPHAIVDDRYWRKQLPLDREEIDQNIADEEFWNRGGRQRQSRDDLVGHPVVIPDRHQSKKNRQRNGNRCRAGSEEKGIGQPLRDRKGDVLPRAQGFSEIARQEPVQPVEVANIGRLIQSELISEICEGLWGRGLPQNRLRDITRQYLGACEDQD